jgi:hypothetical protein
LYLLIHKLAGSTAIYGFDGISRTAGEIETWILAAPAGGVPEPRRGELLPFVSALQSAFATTVTAAVKRRASSAPR